MKTSDFEYVLPDTLIADQPPAIRGSSRLLVLGRHNGSIADKTYKDIVEYLNTGDVLIINNTKVIKARLKVTKESNGTEREIIILEKHGEHEDWHKHKIMYRRKISAGDTLLVGDSRIVVEELLGDGLAIVSSDTDLLELTDRHGSVPLPPYMQREATENDIERYQTVWANEKGSVAAPTASLNMTDETLRKLEQKGVRVCYATLHVGLGTFMPIRVDDVTQHKMHQEYFEVPKETVEAIQKAKASGSRAIALGTTITRTLEYNADAILNQPPARLTGDADIFIYPGYEFKVIDGLITNFHAPHSTVLMLTAAFADWEKLKPAYDHAVTEKYQFFSYGDSMLII